MLEFACWSCGKSLKAAPKNAGRKCKCHSCDELNTIPNLSTDQIQLINEPDDSNEPVEPSKPANSVPATTSLTGKIFCFKCGVSIFAEAEICPHCGVRQRRPGTQPSVFFDSVSKGRNKVIAFLLAFFFGILGAHKFYLGKIVAGIVYLIIGVAGWLVVIPLFWFMPILWFLYFVPASLLALISFIEGILYLSMSDADFAEKYR